MIKPIYVCCGFLGLCVLLVLTPLPFTKPKVLHDIFGSAFGEAFLFGTFALLFLSIIVSSIWLAVEWILSRQVNEVVGRLALFFACLFVFLVSAVSLRNHFAQPPESIYLTNKDTHPEEFINPYIQFKMVDCRDLSPKYGVVFISGSLSIETNYLAYAPDREDKRMHYLPGRKFGEDWYWETTGSQWDRDLFNCVNRNKSPNS